jgi:ketosteroid isomerase-like protein
MKVLIKMILVLVGCVSLQPVLAQPSRAPVEAASVAGTIRQLARDWGDAMIAGDIDKLNQIVADDWVTGYPGHTYTKANFISDVRAGKHRLLTCQYGPHEVKVIGDVAIVQGTVTETRGGQDGSFHVAYTDVWAKRGNRWMVVRSLGKSNKE